MFACCLPKSKSVLTAMAPVVVPEVKPVASVGSGCFPKRSAALKVAEVKTVTAPAEPKVKAAARTSLAPICEEKVGAQ